MLKRDVLLYVLEIIASHVDKNVIDMVETNVSSANGAKLNKTPIRARQPGIKTRKAEAALAAGDLPCLLI